MIEILVIIILFRLAIEDCWIEFDNTNNTNSIVVYSIEQQEFLDTIIIVESLVEKDKIIQIYNQYNRNK